MSSTIGNLSNVYNFYMTSYAPKSSSPYDSHNVLGGGQEQIFQYFGHVPG